MHDEGGQEWVSLVAEHQEGVVQSHLEGDGEEVLGGEEEALGVPVQELPLPVDVRVRGPPNQQGRVSPVGSTGT